MRALSLILPLILWHAAVYAQATRDSLDLDPVEVEATRIEKDLLRQPVYVSVADSAQLKTTAGQDLGYALQQFSNLYVRNNGPGGASLISQRGLGAEQTRVVWEGLPLNHQMLGSTDLSLIQTGLISALGVSGSSGSSRFGSGTSGTVVLQTETEPGTIEAGQSIGEFGNYVSFGRAGVRSGRWDLSVSASRQDNENDFRYYDQRSNTERNRRRGSFLNEQGIISARYRGKKAVIKTSLWYSRKDLEIAENIFSGPGTATQQDESLRFATTLQAGSETIRHDLSVQGAFTRLDYLDPRSDINSLSDNYEIRSRYNHHREIDERLEMDLAFSGSYVSVSTNNFEELRDRSQGSTTVQFQYQVSEDLTLFPAARYDYFSDFGSAVSPSVGLNYQILPGQLALRASAGRNFRAPTFNDLYWPNGGNEDLNAEYSGTLEAGLVHRIKGSLFIQNQLSGFLIQLDDGIRWLPDAGGTFLAQNIEQIRSAGLEWENKLEYQYGQIALRFTQFLSYNRAWYSEERFSGDDAVGNQLRYVPEWQWKGHLGFDLASLGFFVNSRFSSIRFTTEDENPLLAADEYLVTDAGITYGLSVKSVDIRFSVQVFNVFDQRYEITRFYPMPLRNVLSTINLKYKL